MNFSAPQVLADRKIDDGNKKNVITIGAGSYSQNANVAVGEATHANVLIGRYCSLAGGISFNIGMNHVHHNSVTTYPFDSAVIANAFASQWKKYSENPSMHLRYSPPNNYRQIIIGHDVWIGSNAVVMSGVKIGNGAIVGGHAVVAKDVPPYAVVVGNPARVVKYRFPPDVIKKFLSIRWWNWHLDKVVENIPLMYRVDEFLKKNYSPEIDEFLKSPASAGGGVEEQIIQRLRFGSKFYQFIADFRAAQPLWKRIVSGFAKSNSQNDLLLIWGGVGTTDEDFKALNEFSTSLINEAVSRNIFVLRTQSHFNFLPYILRKATHFITTREMVTLEALDWLYDTDVKIISALDDGIFDGEPAVLWEKFS